MYTHGFRENGSGDFPTNQNNNINKATCFYYYSHVELCLFIQHSSDSQKVSNDILFIFYIKTLQYYFIVVMFIHTNEIDQVCC